MEQKQFQVLRIEKRKSIPPGLERHIARQWQVVTAQGVKTVCVWVPDNADPDKTIDNVELISRSYEDADGVSRMMSLQQAVNKRIDELGINVRKGQATSLEIICSGSHDTMTGMSRDELYNWSEDTISWVRNHFGEENVISATLHVDEETPHLHVVVVPVVYGISSRTAYERNKKAQEGHVQKEYSIDQSKPRLSANEVFSLKKLYEYHDSYAKEVGEKYNLLRGIKGLPGSKKKHVNSQEYNRMLDVQIAGKEKRVAELDDRIENNVAQIEAQNDVLKNNQAHIETQNAVIEKNRSCIAEQDEQIEKQQAHIENLSREESSKEILADAFDRRILDGLQTVKDIQTEFTNLSRSVVSKKEELELVDANLRLRLRQMDAEVNLEKVPQKGHLGYNASEVTDFIKSVHLASLREAMQWTPLDFKMDSTILEENTRLQKVEDDYEDFKNSPERLQQRLDEIKEEKKRRSITETLNYVFEQPVNVVRFETNKTEEGEGVFVKFSFTGDSQVYSGAITFAQEVIYTQENLNSIQEAREKADADIWISMGFLPEIRKRREKEDTIKRFSNKLSLLVCRDVQVKDYDTDGRHYLLHADDGLAYFVSPNGDTWSTDDKRVQKLADVKKYANTASFKELGNINNPRINRGVRM